MERIRVKARSKINLSLDIKGLMDNGYHEVEMIMQSINLYDRIFITKKQDGFSMSSSSSDVPLDGRNIIYKTWALMKERFMIESGIDVFLEKNIPIAAGMAGGSADSAAMIMGINELFDLKLNLDDMKQISYELGSDIAFCFEGGTQLATGRGIDLEKLPNMTDEYRLLICKPNAFVSTKKVYKKYDSITDQIDIKNKPNNETLIKALKENDSEKIFISMGNVLEPVTSTFVKDIDKIKKTMKKYGAFSSMMTGSGPTVFGFFKDYNDIKKCSLELRKEFSQTYITKISDIGVEIYGNRKVNTR